MELLLIVDLFQDDADDDFPENVFGRLNVQSESEEDEDDAPPRLRNIL